MRTSRVLIAPYFRVAVLFSLCLSLPQSGGLAAERRSGSDPLRRQGVPLRRPVEPRGLVVPEWGVEIFGVRRTAGGYLLEFRYRVLDAERAAPLFVRKTKPLFVRKTKPRLIDQSTGSVFIVPAPGKVGSLRNSDVPIEGRIYWTVFASGADRFIPMGARVTVEIGDFRIQNLVVD